MERQSGVLCLTMFFINLSITEQRAKARTTSLHWLCELGVPASSQKAGLSLWLPLLRKWNSARLISLWPWSECRNIINCRRRKHGAKCIRCISEILVDFSMNLAPVFRVRPEAKPSRFVCVFTKASLRVCLNGKGTETNAVWARCSANTDSAWVIVWDREESERPTHTANTPSCSEWGLHVCVRVCTRPCTCARP